MKEPEVAVLVSSFQRPYHLQRVLASIAEQRAIPGGMEVVVTDDGSRDETHSVVEAFASAVRFPVSMTTHHHNGFQLARCRNEGVAASRAPYLLFLDGDCLIPPDHVACHLRRRQPGRVMAGYCCHLDRSTTERLSTDDVVSGHFVTKASESERRKLRRMHRKAVWYRLLRHPTKPKLFGGNVGIERWVYQQVNGYDENFVGWGCEDDDLRIRLRAAGMAIESILDATCTYHLWHPPGETTPQAWRDGANVSYLQRSIRPVHCNNGVSKYLTGRCSMSVRRWNHSRAEASNEAA